MSKLPSLDFVCNQLQDSGDVQIILLQSPTSVEAREAINLLLDAARALGLRDAQILLTLTQSEARLQVLPN